MLAVYVDSQVLAGLKTRGFDAFYTYSLIEGFLLVSYGKFFMFSKLYPH